MATIKHNYFVEKRGSEWCVVDKTRTKTLGCHPTEAEANAQLRAIEANKATADPVVKKFACSIEGWPIFRTGTWNGDSYEVTDLQQMADAFTKVGFQPPFKLGHVDDPGAPAIGWVSALRVEQDALVVDITDVDPKVCEGIVQHNFGPPSAEIFWDFERNGASYPRVLGGVALLGGEVPAVAGLSHARDHLTQNATWESVKTYELPDGPINIKVVPMKEPPPMPDPTELRLTVAEMETICPPCAAKMKDLKFKELKIPWDAEKKVYQVENIPPQMLAGLCDKYGEKEGFRTRCMENISPKISDPGAFCNALKEHCTGLAEAQTPKEMTVATDEKHADEKKSDEKPTNGEIKTPKFDSIWLAIQDDLGLKTEHMAALRKRLLGEAFVAREEHDALRNKLTELDEKETKRREAVRQASVDQFAASIISPRFRAYLRPLFDTLTGGPKVAKFAREKTADGKDLIEDVEAVDILRELAEYANGLTSKMFGELSTEEVKRDERPVETNPREELAQRIKDYAKAHNLHPITDAKKIQDEVFKADPQLKEAYARS